jgi:glutaminase
VLVTAVDLATMAATLANGGVNPRTGEEVLGQSAAEQVLTVMATCGMYDFSGEWLFRVGLPAKSGVSGGVVAVSPSQFGIGLFSPRLDERGNSVRGVQVCQQIAHELGLHFLQPPRPSASSVRARYTLAGVRSKRRRTADEARLLEQQGQRAVVFELQGDLRFATLEPVLRAVVDAGSDIDYAVLDFKGVSHVDDGATRMLARLASCCAARGQDLLLSRVLRGDMLGGLGAELAPQALRSVSFQPQLDTALECCERGLLARHAAPAAPRAFVPLADHRLCAGLSPTDLQQLQSHLVHQQHESGALIVRRGEPADALYLLEHGEVSVIVELPQGGHKRLSTLAAGMAFGEAALVAGGVRSADVRADTAVAIWVLGVAAFGELKARHPVLAITLLNNLLGSASETIHRLTAEVSALEG